MARQVECCVQMHAAMLARADGWMPTTTKQANWFARRLLGLRYGKGQSTPEWPPPAERLRMAGFDPETFRIVDYEKFYEYLERYSKRKRRRAKNGF